MDDRISSLPDEILCYILSFLPTKQAVASSVLSKRWIFLWRSVSSFDFCSTDFDFDINKGESHFIRSVESFLDRRDRDQPLHKFSLRLPFSHFDASDNGRLGLLNLYLDKHCPIPLLKFCKTLVVLKLTNLSLEDNFSVDLPLLKILHLNEVDLPDCLDLVFRCPNLEDLELNFMQCAIKGKTNMFTKLVRLSINDGYCPLKIFNNVQVLTFDLWFQSNLDLGFVFHNLVQLEMDFRPRNDWLRVFEVLKYSPKLQSLVICIHPNLDSPCYEEDVWPYPEDVWPYPETVPACISSHLKTCSLIYYSGYKGDFHFARYILENAKYLRTMRIRIGQRNGNDIMKRELSSCMKIRYLHPFF